MENKDTLASPPFRDIYTVGRLNREVRSLLENSYPLIWLEGELSNLAQPGSGHWYFSLKDQNAQVRCAMFRNRNRLLGFTPENGAQVLVRARIGLYEARGEFQLIIEHMEEAGDGALRRAFEALKQRLSKEGLFDAAHKRPLPNFPTCLGVITSPTGAAIRDILATLRRRFPSLPVIVYPTPVQGAGAASQIAASLQTASQHKKCDVLILARGGGSLEDLWAFNEEAVARALFACDIPLVTGIGHEIDFTIADFVADQRAATPTAAAELVSPDKQELLQRVHHAYDRVRHLMQGRIELQQEKLSWLYKRLQHPGRRLQDISQRLDELQIRQYNALRHLIRHIQAQLKTQTERLHHLSPINRLKQMRRHTADLTHRLTIASKHRLTAQQQRFLQATHALETVSPLATLNRGYAIITKLPEDTIVRQANDVSKGDNIRTRLGKGQLICQVNEVDNQC